MSPQVSHFEDYQHSFSETSRTSRPNVGARVSGLPATAGHTAGKVQQSTAENIGAQHSTANESARLTVARGLPEASLARFHRFPSLPSLPSSPLLVQPAITSSIFVRTFPSHLHRSRLLPYAPITIAMASRVFAPKMASMAAQTSVKASRPAFRAAFKPQQASRQFSSIKSRLNASKSTR